MSFFRQLVMGVVFVVMAECPLSGQQQGKAPEEFEGATPHCYKKTAEGELYLHVFLPQKGRQRNRPAALFFFGGSWNGWLISDSLGAIPCRGTRYRPGPDSGGRRICRRPRGSRHGHGARP